MHSSQFNCLAIRFQLSLNNCINVLSRWTSSKQFDFYVGMCRIDFFISVRLFKKNSDSVQNELGSLQLENNTVWFGYYSYLLLVQ